MAIKILITGGTIDDLEYSSPGERPKSHRTLIPELLKQARVTMDYSIERLYSTADYNETQKLLINCKVNNNALTLLNKCYKSAKKIRIVYRYECNILNKTLIYIEDINIEKIVKLSYTPTQILNVSIRDCGNWILHYGNDVNKI